ncbi:gamma-glutamyl transpeptidase precursor [Aphelenchoides avenae]|nr:gamma-glutamyl transpeptidase precursor [Aphelenchus avenae]
MQGDTPATPLSAEANGANGTAHSPEEIKAMRRNGLPWILAAFAVAIVVLLIGLFFFGMKEYGCQWSGAQADGTAGAASLTDKDWPAPNPRSVLGVFPRAAVVSDNGLCSEIGRSVLLRGGNAVDASIATAACVGALNSHSSGLGGGFLMTVYNKFYGKCTTLDARETAPLSTSKDTFVSDPKNAFVGYKSVAVPGELHGYWKAFKAFGSGRIAWQDLLMPTIHLLNNGYPVTKLMEISLEKRKDEILAEPSMAKFFTNNQTGELYKEGEMLKNPVLAETLRQLATSPDPVRLFYFGDMARKIAAEFQANEGYITKKDLEMYQTIVDDSPLVNDHFHDQLAMCGPKPSSSFAVTQLIVSLMTRLFPAGTDPSSVFNSTDFYHKFVEVQKFAYAQRTRLADVSFVKDAETWAINMTKKEFTDALLDRIKDETQEVSEYGALIAQTNSVGTSHVSIIDADGNAVSLTSSLNNVLGAVVRSEQLGIVWNDHMDDFSTPGAKNFYGYEPSEANYIEPGKRPLSSMSPMIVYNHKSKQVKVNIGASGGSKIVSSIAQVLTHVLSFNKTVKEAIDFPRVHNQFTPLKTDYEVGVPQVS